MNQPTAIERDPRGGIVITWDDQLQTHWTASQLRQACPCATCREKHGRSGTTGAGQVAGSEQAARSGQPLALPVISAREVQPLAIASMQPVGNYAYQINFSDGHRSGIFSFALLRRSDPS